MMKLPFSFHFPIQGKVTKRSAVFIGLLLSPLLLTACSRPIEKISDEELQRKAEECVNMNEPGAAMIFACDNYRRECERRNKKTGRYICQ